jgi:hypothetical protein
MTTKGGVELGTGEIHNLDRQIEVLMDCKPLAETEVKALCERVSEFRWLILFFRLRRS